MALKLSYLRTAISFPGKIIEIVTGLVAEDGALANQVYEDGAKLNRVKVS